MDSLLEILPLGMLVTVAVAKVFLVVSVTKIYYLVFALLTLVGGVMGFVKAKSVASIVSGAIAGGVLIVASLLLPEHPIYAEVPALCVSVLLAGKFLPDFIHKKAFVPSGLMALLSLASVVLTILALLPK